MIEQSLLEYRRDVLIQAQTDFIAEYVPEGRQREAALALAGIMHLHFGLTLDQYDLDRRERSR